ncbi:MAG: hypothetical protein JNN29_05575 [Chitinophagaceae bacterium]|nr:hypothetical protein [Chitinophagaceae bacterium]MBN8666646.1 hypothetical protein [Chitinophagales bacterium]
MKTESDIYINILKTTQLIHEKYPELSMFISEMPITIPDQSNPEITLDTLEAYNDSLKNLLAKYSKSKPAENS